LTVDLEGLVISLVAMLGGVLIAIYLFKRLNHRVAIGFGGSVALLGLITLFVAFVLLGGTWLWIIGGSGLTVFAFFFFMAVIGKAQDEGLT